MMPVLPCSGCAALVGRALANVTFCTVHALDWSNTMPMSAFSNATLLTHELATP